jgi:hypothetical protein
MNGTSPVLIAFVRGLLLAAGTAAVGAVGAYVTAHSDELGKAWWVPVAVLGWRTVEGTWDRFVRGQHPQDGIAGGRPALAGAAEDHAPYPAGPPPEEAGPQLQRAGEFDYIDTP